MKIKEVVVSDVLTQCRVVLEDGSTLEGVTSIESNAAVDSGQHVVIKVTLIPARYKRTPIDRAIDEMNLS